MKNKMIRTGIAIAGFLFAPIAAQAADLPIPRYKGPAYEAPSYFSWTGFYIGANAGYAYNNSHFTTDMVPGSHIGSATSIASVDAVGTGSATKGGFTGGVQLGYNWQINRFVLGLEGDFNMMSGTTSLAGSGTLVGGEAFSITNSMKPKWMATVRPRIGYAFDRFLVYGTGGVAIVHRQYTQTYSDALFAATGSSTSTDTKMGWVAGLGLEYGLMGNWSIKGEYLYAKFGTMNTTGTVTSTTGGTNTLNGTADLKTQSLRVGVNYRF